MEAPAVDQQMTAGFDVIYNGQPIKGDLVLGALNSLLENKEPYPFKLTAEAFGVDFDLQGLSLIHILPTPICPVPI